MNTTFGASRSCCSVIELRDSQKDIDLKNYFFFLFREENKPARSLCLHETYCIRYLSDDFSCSWYP